MKNTKLVMEEKSEREKRIRNLTKFYYSNPKVQEALLKFSKEREVVPRYFEGFGKRPDMLQYPSDIIGLVNKGATSFHASEEIWKDPLAIDSEASAAELSDIRKSWDLLIDIDCPYLDMAKEAAKIILEALESYGIENYGIKFSGSKGFHIIVSGEAFPEEYEGKMMKDSFPEWPRAITEFLFDKISPEFRKRVGKIISFSKVDESKSRIECKICNTVAKIGNLTKLICPVCQLEIERRDYKATKRRLKCLNNKCAGVLEPVESQDYFYCENCKDPDNDKVPLTSNKYPENFAEIRGETHQIEKMFDLVLVAPRHLFRMPYSLHEKTSLASVVLKKEEIENFSPRDANPMNVKIVDFLPKNRKEEAKKLLAEALKWKKDKMSEEEKKQENRYSGMKSESYGDFDFSGVNEKMFPPSIKKLLLGLKDGKKRGLFILLTFFKSIGMTPEYINNKVREWNKLNEPPLKEGYIKSQLDWHLKQRKKILPPNYDNESFYKDLGLIDKKPEVKNPIVEVMRNLRKG